MTAPTREEKGDTEVEGGGVERISDPSANSRANSRRATPPERLLSNNPHSAGARGLAVRRIQANRGDASGRDGSAEKRSRLPFLS